MPSLSPVCGVLQYAVYVDMSFNFRPTVMTPEIAIEAREG